MNLFVNDTPVIIVKMAKYKPGAVHDNILDSESLTVDKLVDNCAILNATHKHIDDLFAIVQKKKLKRLHSVTLAVEDIQESKDYIKSKFRILKAGGGVVFKKDKILLIYRQKKWDLPKGKLHKREKMKEGAIREVEEECNVKVSIEEKIGNTWHSYKRNGKQMLKKTAWYKMKCLDDKDIAPQLIEDITKVEWHSLAEVERLLTKSYRSLRHVIRKLKTLDSVDGVR